MITTLYGPDSYRRLKKLNELVNFFVAKRGAYSHERLELVDNEDLLRLKGFLATASMFGPKKLIILDNPFSYPGGKELKEVLRKSTDREDTNIIINTEKKFEPPFKFLLQPPNIFLEFKQLEGEVLAKFIEKKAAQLGLKLTPLNVAQIEQMFGSDTWRIVTELERLSLAPGRGIDHTGQRVDYFQNLSALKRERAPGDRLVALEKLLSGARYDAERIFNGLAFRPSSEAEVEMYADYNIAARAGRMDYEEALVAVAVGLKFNPLDW
jgi:hypothetical protein